MPARSGTTACSKIFVPATLLASVMIEALATGTPVIANKRGSVPEIVRPDVGFITQSQDDIVSAIGKVDTISRARCRQYVCEHFDCHTMAQGYISAYETVLEGDATDAEEESTPALLV